MYNPLQVNIMTINVNGLGNYAKRQNVLYFLENLGYDIFLIQETHCFEFPEWKGSFVASYGTSNSRGCAILFKRNLGIRITNQYSGPDGRLCYADIDINGCATRLVCVYAPNHPSGRQRFFSEELSACLSQSDNNIIAGDFNCVHCFSLDTLNGSVNSEAGSSELGDLCTSFNLHDLWRVDNNQDRKYTWRRAGNETNQASRIDRFYFPVINNLSVTFEYLTCPYSDHDCVGASLDIASMVHPQVIVPGKSYWKLNCSILSEQSFRDKYIEKYLMWQTLKPAYESPTQWWESVKGRTKDLCIEYCVDKSQAFKNRIKDLSEELDELIMASATKAELDRVKTEIKTMNETKLEALRVRSRIKIYEQDEKNTSYFFGRIKAQNKIQSIESVRDEATGRLLQDQPGISDAYRMYYSKLYQKVDCDPVEAEYFLNFLVQPTGNTPVEQQDEVDADFFSKAEIKEALGNMENNKTPGPDGLPKEFYVTFFDTVIDDLCEVYNYILTSELMPKSMSEAVTILLHKGGDPSSPDNKRPISLLNVDYKVVAKIANKWLGQYLPDTISEVQTCGISNRNIVDNLLCLRDSIEYNSKCTYDDTVYISLDQSKAFDRVDHTFLFAAMSRLGIDKKVCKLVKIMYKNLTTQIQINGWLSEPVVITRGVRQGCPLSPSLYVIYIEAMVRALSSHHLLSGCPIPGQQNWKCLAYADDILVACHASEVNYIFEIFEQFYKATGSYLNKGKTEILASFGSVARYPAYLSEFSKDTIKFLGVQFSINQFRELSAINWNRILEKAQSRVESYKKRRLSMPGKILLLNVAVFPLFFYLASTFLPPKSVVDTLLALAVDFIWSPAKKQMISKQFFYLDKCKGGWDLLHFPSKTESLFFTNNLIRCVNEQFKHPRRGYFKYFFAVRCRDLFPECYDNASPHILVVKKSSSYFSLIALYRTMSDKLETISPFVPSTHQLYKWLLEAVDLPEKVLVKHPAGLGEDEQALVWQAVQCKSLSAKYKDFFWRLAAGCLKTGEVVSRWNIPGVNPACVYCNEELETASHIFMLCQVLRPARELLVTSGQQWLGLTVNTSNAKEMLSGVFSHKVDSKSRGDTGLRHLVVGLNKVIWDYRCRIIFEREAFVFEVLKARFVARVKPFFKDLIEDE